MKWQWITSVLPLLASSVTSSSPEKELWSERVDNLKGDDFRLFRPDASEHTAERQSEGDCDQLSEAAQLLVSPTDAVELKMLAAEYAVLCMLDNPANRATFADAVPDIHKAVVALVESDDQWISALACNLIFIGTFANKKNHQAFYQQGAVEALAKILLNSDSIAVQAMYAAAALSNLAASYCETEGNADTCYWEWSQEYEDIQLAPGSSMISDGTGVRIRILEIEGLVDALAELACNEPIKAAEDGSEEEVVMPGSTAVEYGHENEPKVVTWAAMDVFKNLALEPLGKPYLEEKGVLECACALRDSADWLEQTKSYDVLSYMRRTGDPCWENEDKSLCVDGNFLDEGNYTCDDLLETPKDDCEFYYDKFTSTSAEDSCCQCGRGWPWEEEEPEYEEYEEYEEML